jgi:hypothetical protein
MPKTYCDGCAVKALSSAELSLLEKRTAPSTAYEQAEIDTVQRAKWQTVQHWHLQASPSNLLGQRRAVGKGAYLYPWSDRIFSILGQPCKPTRRMPKSHSEVLIAARALAV